MKFGLWVFALSLMMARVAMAQPVPPQAQPQPPGEPAPMLQSDPTGPPLEPGPASSPPPPPAPAPPAPAPPMHQEGAPAEANRPAGLAFGIGVGYVFPTSLQTPNTTSVRLRLASGVTFEPQVVAATTSTEVGAGITATDKQTEVVLGSLVRFPLRAHNKIDFEFVGRAAISTLTVDPEGDNNKRTIIALGLDYGVALAYWLTPHWNLSLTAANPLVSYTHTRQEFGAGSAMVNKSTTIGVVFDPQVALMIHLYD